MKDETIDVLFLRSGLTCQDQVHIQGTVTALPVAMIQTEEEQRADLGHVYYRELRDDDTGWVPASESYLAPRHEEAQMNSKLLTVAEVCDILRVHKATVHAMIAKGLLAAAKLDPTAEKSPWRIRRSSLIRFLDDDALDDDARVLLGRPPRVSPSDPTMTASTGMMLGTAVTVMENEAIASWREEDAAEATERED